MSDTFTCALCRQTFNRVRSQEEAHAEAERLWEKPVEEWDGGYEEVCDDCYRKIDPKNHPEKFASAKKQI